MGSAIIAVIWSLLEMELVARELPPHRLGDVHPAARGASITSGTIARASTCCC